MSAQVRLEALKLAVQAGAEGGNIITIAEEYTDFITNGPKVRNINPVAQEAMIIPQEPVVEGNRQQRRSRKHHR